MVTRKPGTGNRHFVIALLAMIMTAFLGGLGGGLGWFDNA
jgi:hypothetical protein